MICCHNYCLDSFALGTIKYLLAHWSGLDAKAATTLLTEILHDSHVDCKTDRSSVLDGQYYNLRLEGQSVCLNAFKWLTITSHTKLLHLVSPHDHEFQLQPIDELKDTKEQRLKALLEVIFQYNKKPFKWWDGFERLEGFSSKKEVFQFLINFEEDSETPILPSQDLFYKVWNKYFHTIGCKKEDPECAQCAQLKVAIQNCKEHNDPSLALYQSQLQEHINFVHAEREYDKTTTAKAQFRP